MGIIRLTATTIETATKLVLNEEQSTVLLIPYYSAANRSISPSQFTSMLIILIGQTSERLNFDNLQFSINLEGKILILWLNKYGI